VRWGSLRDHFKGVAWKRLTSHEVDPQVSNGHEFQGINRLRDLLGDQSRRSIPTTYLLLADDEEDSQTIRSVASWYDARENQPHRSAEWRLYYPEAAGAIQSRMRSGDLMLIAVLPNDELAVMLTPKGSYREGQIAALFGITDGDSQAVNVRSFSSDSAIGFIASTILDELGLARSTPAGGTDAEQVERIAAELASAFPLALPSGAQVSARVHERITDVDPVADPDGALVRWVEAEAAVFRLWEDARIRMRIEAGFVDESGKTSVDAFRDFTMKLRQSRVSRAGGALQTHVARVLRAHRVAFEAQATTENGERPDFLFPGAAAYHDAAFPSESLHMLAVKFTLKDRWRQVLNEAGRIRPKHLLTMDASLTGKTLEAIRRAEIALVIAREVREFYPENLRTGLMSLGALIDWVLAEHRETL
jgi:hypothetical protein